MVFPEAQPPNGLSDEIDIARALLSEDRTRVDTAARLTATWPQVTVASDRCHIGVLAYRYALAAIGRASWNVFNHAMLLCDQFGLAEGHAADTILIWLLDPGESVRRREKHHDDPRYQVWYDHGFLSAYNDFLEQLPHWMSVGASWEILGASDPAARRAITELLPETGIPSQHPSMAQQLACCNGCEHPRSPVVIQHRVPTQLHASALHREDADGSVRCLHTASEIAEGWTTAFEKSLRRKRYEDGSPAW